MSEYTVPVDILIADDHRIMVEGLSHILKDEKMIGNIYTAPDGKSALAIIQEQAVDCVILDINMPILNGIDAARQIKILKPYIKIIMMSMLCDASIVTKSLKAGADAFVIKNTGKEELLKAITKVMNDEKYVSEELSYSLFNTLGRRADKEASVSPLTQRETEIIRFIAEGMTNQDIADKLFISRRTVDTHRKNILHKLHIKNTASLIKYAADNRLL